MSKLRKPWLHHYDITKGLFSLTLESFTLNHAQSKTAGRGWLRVAWRDLQIAVPYRVSLQRINRMDLDDQQINEGILIKPLQPNCLRFALLIFLPLDHSGLSPQDLSGRRVGVGGLLNISQMNGNQNQMTQLPGPIIGSEFEWSGGCDAPSLISLANAFLSPISVTMTKGLGAKSGHEPLFLMTAESVGNFSCAATRNDCNASVDAMTGRKKLTALSLSLSCTDGFLVYVTLQMWVLWWLKKKIKIYQSERQRGVM